MEINLNNLRIPQWLKIADDLSSSFSKESVDELLRNYLTNELLLTVEEIAIVLKSVNSEYVELATIEISSIIHSDIREENSTQPYKRVLPKSGLVEATNFVLGPYKNLDSEFYETSENSSYPWVQIGEAIVEDCNNCIAKGSVVCIDCNGQCRASCNACSGSGLKVCRKCVAGKNNCRHCAGSGRNKENGSCMWCSGSGQSTCNDCYGNGEVRCNNCNGMGYLNCSLCKGLGRNTCDECNGVGKLSVSVNSKMTLRVNFEFLLCFVYDIKSMKWSQSFTKLSGKMETQDCWIIKNTDDFNEIALPEHFKIAVKSKILSLRSKENINATRVILSSATCTKINFTLKNKEHYILAWQNYSVPLEISESLKKCEDEVAKKLIESIKSNDESVNDYAAKIITNLPAQSNLLPQLIILFSKEIPLETCDDASLRKYFLFLYSILFKIISTIQFRNGVDFYDDCEYCEIIVADCEDEFLSLKNGKSVELSSLIKIYAFSEAIRLYTKMRNIKKSEIESIMLNGTSQLLAEFIFRGLISTNATESELFDLSGDDGNYMNVAVDHMPGGVSDYYGDELQDSHDNLNYSYFKLPEYLVKLKLSSNEFQLLDSINNIQKSIDDNARKKIIDSNTEIKFWEQYTKIHLIGIIILIIAFIQTGALGRVVGVIAYLISFYISYNAIEKINNISKNSLLEFNGFIRLQNSMSSSIEFKDQTLNSNIMILSGFIILALFLLLK